MEAVALAIELAGVAHSITAFLRTVREAPHELLTLIDTVDQMQSNLTQVHDLMQQQYSEARMPGSPVFVLKPLELCKSRIEALNKMVLHVSGQTNLGKSEHWLEKGETGRNGEAIESCDAVAQFCYDKQFVATSVDLCQFSRDERVLRCCRIHHVQMISASANSNPPFIQRETVVGGYTEDANEGDRIGAAIVSSKKSSSIMR